MALELLVATRNAGKVRELVPMVRDLGGGARAVSLDEAGLTELDDEDALEAFDTFEENALAKARYFHRRSGGRAVIADDSGLAVHALGGAPGVRSKRWSGAPAVGRALDDANNDKLLRALDGVPDRRAAYVCAAAIVWSDGEVVGLGECTGTIIATPRGSLGFGYDPFFLSDELGVTFGEASVDQKSGVSHRGRAVRVALAKFAESTRARRR